MFKVDYFGLYTGTSEFGSCVETWLDASTLRDMT